jgi:membrane protein YqaA with SNARE-associated domain
VRPLDLILLAAGVFGVNLLPAFGPPTWALLVFARLHSSIPAIPLVLVGAASAAGGRLLLGLASGHFKERLSSHRREGLESLRELAERRRGSAALGLALFALSPVPSAQLFVGAGILGVRLVPLTAAFFAGRLVSYSIYVAGASAARKQLGSVLSESFSSPIGIAIQLVMLAALVALVRIDWSDVIARRRARGSGPVRIRGARERRARRDRAGPRDDGEGTSGGAGS